MLRRAWDQRVPGGRLVIMDAKIPPGPSGKFVLPFSLWLMKHTMLGNPLIHPWEELASLTEHWDMSQQRFNSYLHLLRNQTQRSDEPRRGDRHERRRLSDCGGINVHDRPRIIGFAKTRTPTDAVS